MVGASRLVVSVATGRARCVARRHWMLRVRGPVPGPASSPRHRIRARRCCSTRPRAGRPTAGRRVGRARAR